MNRNTGLPGRAGIFLKDLFFRMKDSLLLAAWIGGLLLLGGFLWYLSRPLRIQFLQNSVNRVLSQSGDTRRLGSPLPRRKFSREMDLRGTWYTQAESENLVLVFSVMTDGIFVPCAAMVSPGGMVEEILPLSVSAEKALDRLSPGFIGTYIRGIEGRAKP